MDRILSALPTPDVIGWFNRNKTKLAGFAAGIFGTLFAAAFLSVVVTGNPIGEPAFDPDRPVVYPNF